MSLFYLLLAVRSVKYFVTWIWWRFCQPKNRDPPSSPSMVIKRVPQEIWESIFIYFDSTLDLPFDRRSPPSQITASHVCRQWRYAVFSTRGLWSHVNITFPNMWYATQNSPSYRNLTFLDESLQWWLECSGTRPIHLALGSLPHPLFDTISRHVEKCASLASLNAYPDLITPMSTFDMIVSLAKRATVDMLLIDLRDRSTWQVDDTQLARRAAHLSKDLLNSAHWQNLHTLCWNSPSTGFPFHNTSTLQNLETLSIEGPTNIGDCIAFLRSHPNLTSLSLLDLNIHANAPTVLHRGIQSLDIRHRTGDPYLYLDHFTLPSLTQLSLTSYSRAFTIHNGIYYLRCLASLTHLQLRSSCTIRSFHITERFPHPDAFRACLTHTSLQNVEYLTISMDPTIDGTCRALRDDVLEVLKCSGPEAILRKLKALELLHIATTDGQLADVVKSRIANDAMCEPLEEVRVVYAVEKGHDYKERPRWHPLDAMILKKIQQENPHITIDLEVAVFTRPTKPTNGSRAPSFHL